MNMQPHGKPDAPASKTPWYRQLPAKAAGALVFLVGLTTLAGNLIDLDHKRRDAEDVPVAAPPATPAPPAAPQDATEILRVERIVVAHDGSPGTTDWRFSVIADGDPLFAFRQDDLDDGDGRNVALPSEAQALLHFHAGRDVRIEVRGWRESRLRVVQGAPDATGLGTVAQGTSSQAIHVVATDPDGGDFVFHFGLEPR